MTRLTHSTDDPRPDLHWVGCGRARRDWTDPAVEQNVLALEVAVHDAALVAVLDGVAHLLEPDAGARLRDAPVFPYRVEQVAAERLLHYDVHPRRRLDRLHAGCHAKYVAVPNNSQYEICAICVNY